MGIVYRICLELTSKFSKDILKYPFISYVSFHILFMSFDILGGELPNVHLRRCCVVCNSADPRSSARAITPPSRRFPEPRHTTGRRRASWLCSLRAVRSGLLRLYLSAPPHCMVPHVVQPDVSEVSRLASPTPLRDSSWRAVKHHRLSPQKPCAAQPGASQHRLQLESETPGTGAHQGTIEPHATMEPTWVTRAALRAGQATVAR